GGDRWLLEWFVRGLAERDDDGGHRHGPRSARVLSRSGPNRHPRHRRLRVQPGPHWTAGAHPDRRSRKVCPRTVLAAAQVGADGTSDHHLGVVAYDLWYATVVGGAGHGADEWCRTRPGRLVHPVRLLAGQTPGEKAHGPASASGAHQDRCSSPETLESTRADGSGTSSGEVGARFTQVPGLHQSSDAGGVSVLN